MRQLPQCQWYLDEVLVQIHSSVYNHFAHQRNIESRARFKSLRDAALLDWCELIAA
ncbi:hypothetical protein HY29_17335 [Hyphomonas beringensis]|uniref:Transposase n=1 Tax=Hyphomonas beringensis TaxID=1280946 RepID=A0A062U4N6_9PROT|nr:hypothetical protein HY29_17335 [Hyphomonas beringensis]